MAILTLAQNEQDGVVTSLSTIEVRFWGPGGKAEQNFFIGSGLNFQANGNIWMEIIYTAHEIPVYYTRTFVHQMDNLDPARSEEYLNSVVEKGEGRYGFGGMLPESGLTLILEKGSYEEYDGTEREYTHSKLEIMSDVGTLFGGGSPGEFELGFTKTVYDLPSAVEFMRALIHEMAEAQQGKHPNPALLPQGTSDWPFARQLNQKSYDLIASDYQEGYFENPLLSDAFDRWLAQLPTGGRVLDAGCGHGDPVIGRLLERGFQTTGADFSRKMLARAREQFPQAEFHHLMTTELDFEAAFDAACSFSSTLYLDPIDLFHSIYRLHCAIKPGGLLFLYGYDLHPGWRGLPLETLLGQPIWSWTYSADEARSALEEHGFFEVLDVMDVTTEEEREERREHARKEQEENQRQLEEMRAAFAAAQAENVEAEEGEQGGPFPPMPDKIYDLNGEPVNDTGQDASGEEGTTGETVDVPNFDFSSLPPPPFYDPIANTAYQYVVIARRK